ncbi:MAG: hypothetical protein R3359_06315 [Marinirhabdus sp.]|nr:hypothetical protein [Marinirhabdus sp.]
MNNSFVFFFAFCAILLSACSNDDDTTPKDIEVANYYALKIGNSWTYDVYRYDQSSMDYEVEDYKIKGTITETQTINGETYFKFESEYIGEGTCEPCLDVIGNQSVRDSLGYLIDQDGVPLFTKETTDPYLMRAENFGDVFGVFDPTTTSVETPSGNVVDLALNESYVILTDGTIAPGREQKYYRDSEGLQVRTISGVNSSQPWFILTVSESTIIPD